MFQMVTHLMVERTGKCHVPQNRDIGHKPRHAGAEPVIYDVVYNNLDPGLFALPFRVVKAQTVVPGILFPGDPASLSLPIAPPFVKTTDRRPDRYCCGTSERSFTTVA
jgi:hypothetical protein